MNPTLIDQVQVEQTDFGWAAACFTEDGMAACCFGRATPQDALTSLNPKRPEQLSHPSEQQLRDWDRVLIVLSREGGKIHGDQAVDDLQSIVLDLTGYTEFQRRVVQTCRKIPPGKTLSYGQLAEAVGRPRAARAVGTVMSQNRFPLIVPCHRVVAANSLGGFSAPDGLSLKRRLLAMEGADFE